MEGVRGAAGANHGDEKEGNWPEHPHTLASINNIESTFGTSARWKEADDETIRGVRER